MESERGGDAREGGAKCKLLSTLSIDRIKYRLAAELNHVHAYNAKTKERRSMMFSVPQRLKLR